LLGVKARPFWLLILLVPAFAGCLDGDPPSDSSDGVAPDPAAELRAAAFDTSEPFSLVLEPGPQKVLPVDDVRFDSFDGTEIASAVWRPDTDRPTPVILMISPYFSNGLFTEDRRLIENFVPHGYTFAKVAVRGTSYSDGCMESMGESEQKDIDAAVTFFGEQPWSNGNVAIIGVSYVGTTPWAAASFGNPHLKAIVPISGVTSWFELGFRNGTAEPRTPIHMPLYWAQYGTAQEILEVESDDVLAASDNLCVAPLEGLAASQYAIVTGEMGPFADYWTTRDLRPGVLANYNGSVFVIHGLRDWNVNADMAYPFANALVDKGLEVKHLLGQWQHSWPDATAREEHVRYDFAEILLRYFDTHLKGTPRYHGPLAEVEDNLGLWRQESTWPPADANWTPYYLSTDTLATEPGPGGTARLVNPAGAVDGADCSGTNDAAVLLETPATSVLFSTGPLAQDLRYAGLAQLHVTVAPADPRGGEISADLYHIRGDRMVSRVNHAVMDLKFHAGGHEPQSLSPGVPVVAKMEFYPADVVIPAGDELWLRIAPDTGLDPCTNANNPAGEDTIQGAYLPGQSPAPPEILWGGESSVLRLPVIVRDVGDGKYDGQP
jgi:putative CocE/NonD family hydrolase